MEVRSTVLNVEASKICMEYKRRGTGEVEKGLVFKSWESETKL